MKFRAHDTFFIRKGWLSKGMKHVLLRSDVFIDKENNPMDVLGIGANMVKAMRYWLQVVGLSEESKHGKRTQTLTEFAHCVYANDQYIEEIGTLCLLHYKMATNREEATAWYFFFNEFRISEFSREDFVASLQRYVTIAGDGEMIALRSLNEDFNCIISTYLPRYKLNPAKISAENNIDCPFGELGLVELLNKGKRIYKKSVPAAKSIPAWVIMAIICEQAGTRTEVSLNELLTAPCNIGCVFNLDAINMLELLHQVERLGEIKIIRTAGLDVIRINHQLSFMACVEAYYNSLQ